MTLSTVDAPAFGVAPPAGVRRALPVWVGAWLWATAGLVILMVVVGGATRLTGSGLSITQWRPVAGALPPLSHADWLAEFSRYQESSQAKLLNAGMSLSQFKHIFWWEWAHRQLGRFIGLFFAGGFVFGLATRQFSWRLGSALAGMGVLLGFQGVIGWIMVASGLKAGMTAVEPLDLAAHLLFASLFLVPLVALVTALGKNGAFPAKAASPRHAALMSMLILPLVLTQLALGALVAGSHAGLLVQHLARYGRALRSAARRAFFRLSLVGQSLRKCDAHSARPSPACLRPVGACACQRLHLVAWRGGAPRRLALLLAGIVLAQVALGIATLVHAVPLGLALAHQLLAMFALVAATRLAVLSRSAKSVSLAVARPLAAPVATR